MIHPRNPIHQETLMTCEAPVTTNVQRNRWGVDQRLEFIDFVLYWDGEINRSRITDQFGVSPQQASNDLTKYQQTAPNNLRYDLRSKRYVSADEFQCQFIKPNAERYLGQMTAMAAHLIEPNDTWIGDVSIAEPIPFPARRVDPEILRSILKAIRSRRSLEIHYQSLKSATLEPVWRRITPHSFATDGFRWHVRAFCHRSNTFKDFLLSRCESTRDEQEPGASPEDDADWHNYFSVVLIPNPRLTDLEKKTIELDYDMTEGRVELQIRKALLYYFDKRFRSELAIGSVAEEAWDPREFPVAIENRNEYLLAVSAVGRQPQPRDSR
jgi:hypothetical protein